ncbi:MAG TPA: MlaD family protein [Bacteroidia bacterium]|jgi:phospholipid/cholesterol/gamma-HCH transport system substrate-binding protein|nr:MlaD family protein [Bacteroidia bacterium]
MEQTITKNIKLGIFVAAGTIFLVISLYYIGSKRNLFSSTFRISAIFYNINGLQAGNNVRFSGINVGTVDRVLILNDSSVKVEMLIEEKIHPYIRKNAIATIGTDGLMGNMIVNIDAGNDKSSQVKAGDIISGRKPIETDEMLRTLEVTNKNVAVITENLKTMTTRINSRNSLWSLLMDTVVAENIKEAVVNIKLTGKRTAMITSDLSTIVSDVKGGKGNLGMLLKDTGLVSHLNETMVKIKQAGENAANITNDLGFLTRQVKSGKGTLGTLLIDTSFARKLDKSLDNVQSGTDNFNQDMEALKHNFLLRAYFRKKARTQKADTLH